MFLWCIEHLYNLWTLVLQSIRFSLVLSVFFNVDVIVLGAESAAHIIC